MPDTDIVIAWVNGQDPKHAKKRAKFLQEGPAQETLATKARRFSDNEEIRYNLRSIRNHAPWVRKIWIITDDQFPPSIDQELAREHNIFTVDHRVIYRGFEGCLPVFNSLAIETMLWRIPELAEQFIYCNDDMLLSGMTKETDFFVDGKVVLRGNWADLTDKEISFHASNQLAAAQLYGYDLTRFFGTPHVHYPMLRSVLEEAFESLKPEFARNMAFRFRNRSQFWPISVHAYQAMRTDRAVGYSGKPDWRHFSVRFCKTASAEDLITRLEIIRDHKVKMTCVNYFEAVQAKVPDALSYISEATGPMAPFERPDKVADVKGGGLLAAV
ncbi:Stealth CR1 domain-containing protein [Hansschlegelia plantiphila]|uniref:Capsular biosynthesis protein n=1 Tax=Hansschlegelia plantiphila TaxID=374655 RepID=A0A9W6IZK3_9HYPH|nr:Stealth CR1 domain-containing protein [Hansschlegelia plantiphila]GLK66739.1 hypothetical protein GCM10008179_03770 [Hansschlegelia plantiphila]